MEIQLPGARLHPLELGFGRAKGAMLALCRAGQGFFLLWDLPAFPIPSCEDKAVPPRSEGLADWPWADPFSTLWPKARGVLGTRRAS